MRPHLVVAALILSTRIGHAQSSSEDLQIEFQRGRDANAAGKTHEAFEIYTRLWEKRKSPDIAANLGDAEYNLGYWHLAARHYAYSVQHLLPSTKPGQKKGLDDVFAQVRSAVGRIVFNVTPAAAKLWVDGEPVVPEEQEFFFVVPGPHKVMASLGGQSVSQTVTLGKGQEKTLELFLPEQKAAGDLGGSPSALQPIAVPESEEPPGVSPRENPIRLPMIVTGALATVASAGIGVFFTVKANDKASQRNDLLTGLSDSACVGDLNAERCRRVWALDSDRESAAVTAAVFYGTAGALAAGTIFYALVSKPYRQDSPRVNALFDGRNWALTARASF